MGWPKGKPRGPRKPKDSTIRQHLDSGTGVKTPGSSEDDDFEESGVIVVDKLGFWGISFDVRNVIVQKREKYKNDETLTFVLNGEEQTRQVKAGDWTPWRHERGSSRGPFYSSVELALKYIQKAMVKAELRENGHLDVYLAASKRSEERIEKMLIPKKED